MFNIQPGMGLGYTASKQIALGLGLGIVIVIEIPYTPSEPRGPEDIVQVLMTANRVIVRLIGR